MPLRFRLEQQDETLQSFELAANARYFEGRELMLHGYGGGGMYLLGYAAEMLLKSAYFRFVGARSLDRIRILLRPVQQIGNILIPGVAPEQYHSLRFWALLLREQRRQQNAPLPGSVASSFVSRTRRMHQNWWVGMRYRQDQAQPMEALTLLDDLNWLRDNYDLLRR